MGKKVWACSRTLPCFHAASKTSRWHEYKCEDHADRHRPTIPENCQRLNMSFISHNRQLRPRYWFYKCRFFLRSLLITIDMSGWASSWTTSSRWSPAWGTSWPPGRNCSGGLSTSYSPPPLPRYVLRPLFWVDGDFVNSWGNLKILIFSIGPDF